MSRSAHPLPPGVAVYDRLLWLYPARFRRQWGGEMTRLAGALLARARHEHGLGGVLRLWPRLLCDLAMGAAAERRRAARYIRKAPRPAESRRTRRMLDDLGNDIRGALRLLRRSPGHAAAVILTLALGIGVDTAVFSVVRTALLEALPYHQPDRLVLLSESNPARAWTQAQVAPANFFDWTERSRSFSAMAGFADFLSQSIATGGARPERVRTMGVAGDLFGVLGVPPAQGRSFRPAETWKGAARVAVLSHAYWQRQLAGAPDVLGKMVTLNGNPYEVIGVMPQGFSFYSEDVDLWTPFAFDPADRTATWFRRAHMFRAVARLAPGVSLQQADAEMNSVALQLEREYPATNTQMGAGASPLADYLVGSARRPLTLLFAAAALVLLIATANVAHLRLARLGAQLRDNAVRGCLGASRWRLARRSMIESLTLSGIGAVLGGAIALSLTPALVRLGAEFLPRPSEARVDLGALAFAAGLGVLTALLSGLASARRGARPELERALREGGRAGEGRTRARLRQRLVAAEVALAVMVVAAAVLLVRTLLALGSVHPGFEPRGVTAATLSLPALSYPDAAARGTFLDRYLGAVRALPGVESAGIVGRLPLTGDHWSSDMAVEGRNPAEFDVEVIHREATPGYFETLRVPLRAGRFFRAADDANAPAVVVINQTLADLYFKGRDPIGQRICFDRHPTADSHWRTIVGVVGAERQDGLGKPLLPEILAPLAQDDSSRFSLVVRSALPAATLVPALRRALQAIDPQLPLFDVRTLDEVVATSVARERFLLALFATFAALSLVLAALGVYGVTAEAAAQRRREIAVRLAVGARVAELVRSTVGREMTAVAVGLAAGLAGAFGLGRAMAGLLFGVAGSDPLTLAGAPAVMLTVALVAAWLPARRASRIAPAEVLRQ